MEKTKLQKSNLVIALVLALLVLLVLAFTESQIGLTWDEPAYFAASESYAEWFGNLFSKPGQAFKGEVIDQYWEVNHEHPPLDKVWSGMVWSVAKNVFDDLFAHRLGNMLLVSLLAALLYLMVAENYSRLAGFLAVGVLMTLPRFFFHAHLAALDVPAAVMIFVVVFVFWRTKDQQGWQSMLGLGVVWGAAVATKVNAVFVMPVLFLWVYMFQREKRLFNRLVVSSFIAFGVFLFSWPWLYPNFIARVYLYIRWITVDHWQIGQYYLGQFYMPPPWHFPFVMAFAVIPLFVLVFFVVGTVRSFKEKENQGLGILLFLNALTPLLALSIGQSMVYDNERLFMPAFIFVAALAAVGVDWVIQGIRSRLATSGRTTWTVPAAILLAALVLVPQVVSAAPLYPHLLSYYSGSVGGLRGANRLGLETTYWCETYTEGLEYINENAKPGDVVWVDPWSQDVMVYYQLQGLLRPDVRITVPAPTASILIPDAPFIVADYKPADFIVLQYRQTSLVMNGASWPILTWLEGREPVVSVTHQGVPLFELYRP